MIFMCIIYPISLVPRPSLSAFSVAFLRATLNSLERVPGAEASILY